MTLDNFNTFLKERGWWLECDGVGLFWRIYNRNNCIVSQDRVIKETGLDKNEIWSLVWSCPSRQYEDRT